jgi:hypothetical protein
MTSPDELVLSNIHNRALRAVVDRDLPLCRHAHLSTIRALAPFTDSGMLAYVGVSTLKQGYPLLPYEDAVPTRLSLVAWKRSCAWDQTMARPSLGRLL